MQEKILHKAAEMFLTIGVKSVTMDEIAQELGISKKTIYTHYANKSKLIEATALYITETISNGISEIRKEGKNPIEELFRIKILVMTNLKKEKSSPQYQLQKYFPKVYAVVRSKQLEIINTCVVENLERGMNEGFYRNEIPVQFTSRIYFIGMLGIRDKDLFPEDEFSESNLVDNFLEYHLRALVTEKGLQTLNNFINKKQE